MTRTLLVTQYPHLVAQWDTAKNEGIDLFSLTTGSNRKVWWLCEKGHSFQQVVAARCKGQSCKYCSGNAILVGFNDLATVNPALASEWHPTKNGDLTPTMVSRGSNKRIWWQCEKGHEWEATVNNRHLLGRGCSQCVGQKPILGVNDLTTTHPTLAEQWHPTRNNEPAIKYLAGSHKKVWWLGECGHEWEASIINRSKGKGCPVCSGRQALAGFNDLATTHPAIAAEWHPTRNGELTPTMVTAGSDMKVWWKCEKGHEWETFIYARKKNGCLQCSLMQTVSKSEQELYEFLKNLEANTEQSNRTLLNGLELDIYVPSKSIAVEYNGLYWHSEEAGKTKHYHYNKWLACKEQGVQLIQVWEDDYVRNPDLVKQMLAHKLGVAGGVKVFARKTRVKELTQEETNLFLTQNHIQGAVDGSIRVGLTIPDTQAGVEGSEPLERLVAVMVLKKEPGTNGDTLNLLRFATSQPVVGGFTKLLSYVEKINGSTLKQIITFSDNTVSDGRLYEKNGFVADKELPPDYMYVVGGERKHKFNYRLKRFREDRALKYEEGLSERELALLNNLPRVWDAGKTRWVKTFHPTFTVRNKGE